MAYVTSEAIKRSEELGINEKGYKKLLNSAKKINELMEDINAAKENDEPYEVIEEDELKEEIQDESLDEELEM